MAIAADHPWFHAAVHLLDVRRQDRVLALHPDVGQARDLAALVGSRGMLMVVLQDRQAAEHLAAMELPQVRVLVRALAGDEAFGAFDAMLTTPRTGPLLPPGAYADLARANLRPGGRFVIDAPGRDMVPELSAAFELLGWSGERLAPLQGFADDAFAEVLRGAGLRNVNGLLGGHLLRLQSPADLVAMFAPALHLDDDEVIEVAHAIVRRRGTADALDALVHRTRLQGLR